MIKYLLMIYLEFQLITVKKNTEQNIVLALFHDVLSVMAI